MIDKKTPVGDILFDRPRARASAFYNLCLYYGIETVGQLAAYNRFAFKIGGNNRNHWRARGVSPLGPTVDYLEECLRRVGLSFAPESRMLHGRWPPNKIYGKENAKQDLLNVMNDVGDYASISRVSSHARERLRSQLKPFEEYGGDWLVDADYFSEQVFNYCSVKPLFQELVKEKRVIKSRGRKQPRYKARNT